MTRLQQGAPEVSEQRCLRRFSESTRAFSDGSVDFPQELKAPNWEQFRARLQTAQATSIDARHTQIGFALYLALEQQRPATLDIARKIATSFASSTQTPSNVCTVFTVLWLLDHLDQVQALQADLESAVTLLTSRYSARGWC
jgi:hypothetical protein